MCYYSAKASYTEDLWCFRGHYCLCPLSLFFLFFNPLICCLSSYLLPATFLITHHTLPFERFPTAAFTRLIAVIKSNSRLTFLMKCFNNSKVEHLCNLGNPGSLFEFLLLALEYFNYIYDWTIKEPFLNKKYEISPVKSCGFDVYILFSPSLFSV